MNPLWVNFCEKCKVTFWIYSFCCGFMFFNSSCDERLYFFIKLPLCLCQISANYIFVSISVSVLFHSFMCCFPISGYLKFLPLFFCKWWYIQICIFRVYRSVVCLELILEKFRTLFPQYIFYLLYYFIFWFLLCVCMSQLLFLSHYSWIFYFEVLYLSSLIFQLCVDC